MPAHTDWGTITMLFQDECGGLEVQTADGSYVQAEPVKGAIIMNIGDMLMRWSNGECKLWRRQQMMLMESMQKTSSNQTCIE